MYTLFNVLVSDEKCVLLLRKTCTSVQLLSDNKERKGMGDVE